MVHWATTLLQCFSGNLETYFRAAILQNTHKLMKKVFKDGPSKICGIQSLKNLK